MSGLAQVVRSFGEDPEVVTLERTLELSGFPPTTGSLLDLSAYGASSEMEVVLVLIGVWPYGPTALFTRPEPFAAAASAQAAGWHKPLRRPRPTRRRRKASA